MTDRPEDPVGARARVPLVCPLNVSEGRDPGVIAELAAAGGAHLLDVHTDPDHHRSVLTLAGEDAPRAVAAAAVRLIDLRRHQGVHPRLGAVDVVPFVSPVGDLDEAVAARDRFAAWAGRTLRLPALVYGAGGPTLPAVRRLRGRIDAHPTAGAVAVGARGPLVAYNVWLAHPDLPLARRVAAAVRSTAVRALGLPVGSRVQVSMNLLEPTAVGPGAAFDAVAALAPVAGAELVGLLPERVLLAEPEDRWSLLGLRPDRTVEARLRAAGLLAG